MKHRLLRAMAAAVAILGSSIALTGQDASRIDLTGKWTFQVETSAGGGMPTVTLKQEGEKLTGHYSSANLGEADLTGSVQGRVVAMTFTADVQGLKIDVAYSGTIESKDAMKGKVSLGGLAEGTFTAKRQ